MSNDSLHNHALHNPHGHHDHGHHGHHMMDTTTDTSSMFNTGPATTAATLLQAVMTTVMAHGMHDHHKHHQAQMDSPHGKHISDASLVPHDTSHLSDVHASHVSAGDHMQVCLFKNSQSLHILDCLENNIAC